MAKKTLTENEILNLYVETFANVLDEDLNEKEVNAFFKEVSKIEGVDGYLRSAMARDIQTYFMAQDDMSRERVRGGYARIMYMRAMIKKVRDAQTVAQS
jgi:hypothetical protein